MKTTRPYPSVTIDARGAKRAQEGHPWVFDNEITGMTGAIENGGLCDVRSPKGRYLGTGTYNDHSKIRVRLGLPQGGDGPGPGKLPGDLRGGGPVPRAYR